MELSWKRIAWGAVAALAWGPSALIALRSYRSAKRAAFDPPRPALQKPTDFAELRDVSFGSAALRGWYAPSRNGGAVIFTHGSYSDRSMLVLEGQALARAGFGVLLFDWPGHGESG